MALLLALWPRVRRSRDRDAFIETFAPTYHQLRGIGRGLALRQTARELRVFGIDVGPVLGRSAGEVMRLEWIAARQADVWVAKGEAVGWSHADAHIEKRIRLTGSYETLSSASDERRAIQAAFADPSQYVREWSAVLDRRTCATCAGLDGKWVLADQTFPAGEPGSIHGRCRCMSIVVASAWVDVLDAA